MADWALPALSSTYTNTLTEIKNRDIDLALQFDGTTSSSLPNGAIRWSSSANRWQKWSTTSSTWGELTGIYALTALSTTQGASIGGTLSVTNAASLNGGGTTTTPSTDDNSTAIASTAFVLGQASAAAPLVNGTAAVGTSVRFSRQDHIHPTDTTRAPLASPVFTGTVQIPSGASIADYAKLASPTFTGTVTIPAGASISGYATLASPTFTGTVTIPSGASISGYAPLASPTFSGSVTIPAGASISGYAPLASPSFTGTASFAGDINNTGTGYLDLPSGTTAQRPATPNPGMVRYNTDAAIFETYGSSWAPIGGMRMSTIQSTTSGTTISFTDVPYWAKRVTLLFNDVSTTGTSHLFVQLGLSGGIYSDIGYLSRDAVAGSSGSPYNTNGGFLLRTNAANDRRTGVFTLDTLGNNMWVASSTMVSESTDGVCVSGGRKNFGGPLACIRIVGSNTFNYGSINAVYQA